MENDRKKRIVSLAVNASMKLISNLIANEGWNAEELWLLHMHLLLFKGRLRGERIKPSRIRGYLDVTIPNINSLQFRRHFRMNPEVYEALENRIGPLLIKHNNVGRPIVPVRTQLLVTLWLLATPDSYRSVGDRFDVGKSSASDSFFHVVKSLCSITKDVIKWPSLDRIPEVKQKFFTWGKLPNVIGAIDGTDIEIKAPKVDPQAYNTRKKRTAVILQAVCDSDCRFTDCFAGYPSSVGDVRVLRNSDLYRAICQNFADFFPGEEYIIGDKIYPIYRWLIPAIKDNGDMTAAQRNFNKALASTRQVIERAFALLKGRWRRLKYLDMNKTDMIPYVIIACCVLHNICLDHIINYNEDDDFIQEGLPNVNLRADEGNNNAANALNDLAGEAKRNYLVTLI